MIFSSRIFLLLFLFAGQVQARASLYRRAQKLADSDPLEAEAMLARFVAESGNEKTARAAAYDLFYLRLRHGRLTAAFFQAKSETFHKKYLTAVEEGLRIRADAAIRLVSALRRECNSDGSAEKIGELLRTHLYPLAAYQLAQQVLERCGAEDPSGIFPGFPEGDEKPDKRAVQLALLEARSLVAAGDFEAVGELFRNLRLAGAAVIRLDKSLRLQLELAEARWLAMKDDREGLEERCAAIAEQKPARAVRHACRFLVAYALLNAGDYAGAYAKVASLKPEPTELDNRLLRLTAAVAAGEGPREKLVKFKGRYSYKECAPVLRKLADAILQLPAANK